MNKIIQQILIVCLTLYQVQNVHTLEAFICRDNPNITSRFNPGLQDGHTVIIKKPLKVTTQIRVKLDSESTIFLENDAKFSSERDNINNIFNFIVIRDVYNLSFGVSGQPAPHKPPYITSIKIDGVEQCQEPDLTYFQTVDVGFGKPYDEAPDKLCGRPKIGRRHTELIVGGSATKAGDWPWHTAITRLEKLTLKYVCGGTLISKYMVLTAAHCVAINGVPVNPEILQVILGKHYFVKKDEALQEKDVFQVVVHEEFNHRTVKNDIALLKLTTEAVFNNHVQPACLWFDGIYDRLFSYEVFGTVVGWGYDETDSLSTSLKSAVMVQLADATCIQLNPIFYSNVLNGKTFCGGFRNGVSACNGDSGGGFMVFAEDEQTIKMKSSDDTPDRSDGAWYIKGIVSVSLARPDSSICDPNAYTVFTDVAVYKDWILNNMK